MAHEQTEEEKNPDRRIKFLSQRALPMCFAQWLESPRRITLPRLSSARLVHRPGWGATTKQFLGWTVCR